MMKGKRGLMSQEKGRGIGSYITDSAGSLPTRYF